MLRSILQAAPRWTNLARPITPKFNIMYKTQRYVKDLKLDDLMNRKYIRKIVRQPLPGDSAKSHRGLYHGRVFRTGHRITYADNLIKRYFRPNISKKTFHSNILGKDLTITVTAKAEKCIKKYGGFDNYILLTKPENMRSLFGEYLRKLMIEKLNNPSLNLERAEIFGAMKNSRSKLNKTVMNKDHVWFPKEIRHKDHTMRFWRGLNQMTKEELQLVG